MMLQLLFLLLLIIVIISINNSGICQAQPPQEVHPWRTECGNYGCFVNWFCVPSVDLCIECPNAGFGTTEEHCQSLFQLTRESNETMATSDDDTSRIYYYYYTNETEYQIDLDSCLNECVKPQEGDACSDNAGCDPGRFFCNYFAEEDREDTIPEGAEDDALAPQVVREGICEPCKQDVRECLEDPTISSPFGVEDCVLCDIGVCIPLHYSVTTEVSEQLVEEKDGTMTALQVEEIIDSTALQGSPKAVVTAPLVSCNNLIYRPENTCQAGGNDLPFEEVRQDGKICLVHDYNKNSYFVSVVNKCAALGGVGVIFFQENLSRVPNNQSWTGSLSYLPTTIPSVVVPYDTGIRWEQQEPPLEVTINATDVGTVCIQKQFCNDDMPCVGSAEGQYCDYKWGGGNGGNGFCRECPTHPDTGEEDPLRCFFDIRDEDIGRIMGQSGVESCSATCASSLEFPNCKFCPDDVDGFDFGLESNNDQKCRFCPNNDVLYPDKEFPLFGENVTCWMVQKFFDSVDVNSDARNCELAQMMNYVCGCSGSGYLGANTQTKRLVLVWLPRVMAILSFLGSTFIIWDTAKSPEQRQKVMNQLLIGLSIFDLMGSCAYAFTTLPIPHDHPYGPIEGAHGNEATCTAQGWFIQMGTISAYMNVSLAVYYYLVIKFSWDENRLKRIRWALFLIPMVVGFAFAFAGIPYYDSLNLWCNNTASYWPDIPVAVAIGVATIIMSLVCYDVYTKEQKAARWRGGAAFRESITSQKQENVGVRNGSIMSRISTNFRSSMNFRSSLNSRQSTTNAAATAAKAATGPPRQTLSQRVFWQSFFYLMAFYLTWPPYLALQYAWAGGSSFTNYGLILTAATLVPLQGFWNMLVYIRPRYVNKTLEKLRQKRRRSRTKTTQSKDGGSRWSWLTPSKRSNNKDMMASTDDLPVFSRDRSKGSTEPSASAAASTTTGHVDQSYSTSHHQDPPVMIMPEEDVSFHGDNDEDKWQEEEEQDRHQDPPVMPEEDVSCHGDDDDKWEEEQEKLRQDPAVMLEEDVSGHVDNHDKWEEEEEKREEE